MKLEWLGKHRPLIEDLFYWSNRYAAICHMPFAVTPEESLSFHEIQVIEYLLENEELQLNMAGVARRLGISPGSLTGYVARLEKRGLVQKFYREGNRKDMIVLVTEYGRSVYEAYSRQLHALWKDGVLDVLDEIPDEYCEKFAQALRNLTSERQIDKKNFRPLTPVKKPDEEPK